MVDRTLYTKGMFLKGGAHAPAELPQAPRTADAIARAAGCPTLAALQEMEKCVDIAADAIAKLRHEKFIRQYIDDCFL